MSTNRWSSLFGDNYTMPGDEPDAIDEIKEEEVSSPTEEPVIAAPEIATARLQRSSSDGDWRSTGGPLQTVGIEWNRRATAPVGMITQYTQRGQRKPNTFYDLGTVISAYHHLAGNPLPINKEQTLNEFLSPDGQWIQSKVRKFVVIERSIGHCLVLPIFTYSNRGLAARKGVAQEYIGVFDSESAGPHRSDSSNGFVLVTRAPEYRNVPEGSFHYQSLSAYAHLTAPIVHEYNISVIHEGTVVGEELRKLLAAYKNAQVDNPPKGLGGLGRGGGRWR
ncbi:hypothetical protein WAI453_002964 [Rhynchosporium graminicola]|uniref:DUF6590 domain-containing protein n=1 Tax=Rhynchosporium graminicola TaxID=2792576 RepID=A0A1E1JW94_9HELO|nr:uncharacterized protein RCO7_02318 [Rhynchosporium commune]